MRERRKFIPTTLELRLSCTKPSKWSAVEKKYLITVSTIVYCWYREKHKSIALVPVNYLMFWWLSNHLKWVVLTSWFLFVHSFESSLHKYSKHMIINGWIKVHIAEMVWLRIKLPFPLRGTYHNGNFQISLSTIADKCVVLLRINKLS